MSNLTLSSNMSMSFDIVTANYVLSGISIVYIVVGTTGMFFNILLFTRRSVWSQSSCIPYLLASSIANVPNIYFTILIRVLAGFQITPAYNSRLLCKLLGYVSNSSYASSTWPMVGCCWDRYVSSSGDVRIRRISNMRNTRRIIAVTTFVVLSVYIQKLYCYETDPTLAISPCSNKDAICNTADVCITFSIQLILPIILFLYFGIGTFINVRRFSRQRNRMNVSSVVPIAARRIHMPNNQSILRVVFVQVTILLMCLLPLLTFRIYQAISLTTIKSAMRHSVESFIFNALFLLANFDKMFSFYIYTLASAHFRKEIKRLVCTIYRRHRVMPQI